MQNVPTNPKVLFTGGHAGSTALATIEKLQDKYPCEIHFVGGRSSIEGKKSRTFAQVAFDELGIKVHNLTAGRLQTKFSLWTLPSLTKIPLGFVQAFLLVGKIRPSLTVSFGGYVALPVVIASWLKGIPVVIHEQTSVAGRANRLSGYFATKIALSRASSLAFFPKNKSVVIGNPIPSGVKKLKSVDIHTPPHILVTGGFSGSRAINSLIAEGLTQLLEKYDVVHQTGDIEYDRFLSLRENLPEDLKRKYRVFSVIKPSDWAKYLEWADIFVSRAGANFTYQLLVINKPAVLIPLPFTYMDEQIINARYAKEYGLAEVLAQEEANSDKLLDMLARISHNWHAITSSTKTKVSPDLEASEKLVEILAAYLPPRVN